MSTVHTDEERTRAGTVPDTREDGVARAGRGAWRAPSALLLALLAFAAIRLIGFDNLGTDDVEQALFARAWAWGYNTAQPPAFTWALMASYALFGPSLVAHAALRYLLIGLIFLLAYLAVRPLLPALRAWLASAALATMYPIGWGAHVGFTHTLMLCVAVLAICAVMVRLETRRSLARYVMLGALIGLGILSKYSFGLFFVPLALACAIERRTRAIILDPRFALSIAIGLALAAPHLAWMIEARAQYAPILDGLQGLGTSTGYIDRAAGALSSLVIAIAAFTAPFALVALALFRPLLRRNVTAPTAWPRVLFLTMLIALSALALLALAGQVGAFKQRYFHAILLTMPLAVVLWIDPRAGAAWRHRAFERFVVGVWIASLLALGGKALFEARSCRNCWLQAPYDDVAHAIALQVGEPAMLLSGDEHLGGNLRLRFPHAYVATPLYGTPFADTAHPADGACIVVWNVRRQGATIPDWLASFAHARFAVPDALLALAPVLVDGQIRRSGGRTEPYAFLALPRGTCRVA